jgi:hypothetical protein
MSGECDPIGATMSICFLGVCGVVVYEVRRGQCGVRWKWWPTAGNNILTCGVLEGVQNL